MRDLSRLLRPRSIAVIGGGAWCSNVIEQCRTFGFDGGRQFHRGEPECDG